MLFNCVVQTYKCPDCEGAFYNVMPTSIVPMIIVVATADIFWGRTIALALSILGIAFPLGFIVSVGVLLVTYVMLYRIFAKQLRQGLYPKCGAKLHPSSGGFVDSSVPEVRELLLYAVSISAPFTLWALLGDA